MPSPATAVSVSTFKQSPSTTKKSSRWVIASSAVSAASSPTSKPSTKNSNSEKNIYEQKENRQMSVKVFENMLSNMLYEHRFGPFFVSTIIAGLHTDKNGVTKPYISGTDLIGATGNPEDFITAGNGSDQLMGICEALWRPKMSPDELFECISQSILNAADRDAKSGWGVTVYIVEKHQVTKKVVKQRMD